jgi:hypothetical protein
MTEGSRRDIICVVCNCRRQAYGDEVPWERESLADSVEGMRGNTRSVRAGRVCGVCALRTNRSLKGGITVKAVIIY